MIDIFTSPTDQQIIHQSAVSELLRGKWRGTDVVIKLFHPALANQDIFDEEELKKELNILSKLQHPRLVSLYGVTCKWLTKYRVLTHKSKPLF